MIQSSWLLWGLEIFMYLLKLYYLLPPWDDTASALLKQTFIFTLFLYCSEDHISLFHFHLGLTTFRTLIIIKCRKMVLAPNSYRMTVDAIFHTGNILYIWAYTKFHVRLHCVTCLADYDKVCYMASVSLEYHLFNCINFKRFCTLRILMILHFLFCLIRFINTWHARLLLGGCYEDCIHPNLF